MRKSDLNIYCESHKYEKSTNSYETSYYWKLGKRISFVN